MFRNHSVRFRALRNWELVLLATCILLGALASFQGNRAPVASAETRFVETSQSGLQIVPASCPSSPDYAGQCDGAPQNPGCSVTMSSYNITQGQSTTLNWNSLGGSSWNMSGIGSVGASGSRSVSPALTTTYTLTMGYSFESCDKSGCGTVSGTKSCDATVVVTQGGGSGCQNGLDVTLYPSCVCPAGQHQSGSSCVDDTQTCQNGLDITVYPSCVCPSGQHQSGNACIADNLCQNGLDITQYPSCVCPAGQHQSGDHCVDNDITVCENGLNINLYPSCACPAGQHQSGSSCVDDFCGNGLNINIYPSCTCPAGKIISGSQCVYPRPTVTLKVTPLLVHRNTTVNVEWSSTNVTSCTLTSDAGDSWNTISGTGVSNPIVTQTVFTLSCLGLDGSTATAQQTVKILPFFEEVCNTGFHHVNGVCVPD